MKRKKTLRELAREDLEKAHPKSFIWELEIQHWIRGYRAAKRAATRKPK